MEYSLAGTQSNVSFLNSTISGFSSTGILLDATLSAVSITGTTISSGSVGINVGSSLNGLNISNSTINSLTSNAIHFVSASTVSNVTITSLTANGNTGNGFFAQGNLSDLTVSNSTFNTNTLGGFKVQPGTSKVVSTVSMTNVQTNSNGGVGLNFGGTGSGSGITLSGITSSNNSSNGLNVSRTWSTFSLSNSTFNSNSSDGLQFNLDNAAASLTGITLNNIVSNDNTGSGYQFMGATGSGNGATLNNVTAISNNIDGINVKSNWVNVNINGCIANENGVDGTSGDGDGISYHNSTTGTIKYCFINNNIKSAVAHVGDSDLDMSYNIFRDDTVGTLNSLVYFEGTGTYNMYNNTIYSTGQTGNGVDISTPTGPTLTFKNNIIYGFSTGLKKTAGTLTEDYNLIYNTGTANYSGLTAGIHSISVDPLFTNAGSNDFTLQSSSPAIDTGLAISATYDDALHPNTVFVSSVNTLDQDLRGTGWELGAYIYPVPQAPTMGSVDVLSDSSLKFNFTDNASDEIGFKLYSNTDVLATTNATTNLSSINSISLASNTGFSGYYIKAYNSYGNSIASSGSAVAYTLTPTPTSVSSTLNYNNISLSVPSFTNDANGSSGYYFENTTNSINSGWIQTNSWIDNSVSCNSNYNYSIKFRNYTGTETTTHTSLIRSNGCPSVVPITFLQSITKSSSTEINISKSTKEYNKFLFLKNLSYKMSGEDVYALQKYFQEQGLMSGNIKINGYFGKQTLDSVKKYQKLNKIKQTGFVGPLTRDLLNN
jgi:hypothetical protein